MEGHQFELNFKNNNNQEDSSEKNKVPETLEQTGITQEEYDELYKGNDNSDMYQS